jgi:hypothetical protein
MDDASKSPRHSRWAWAGPAMVALVIGAVVVLFLAGGGGSGATASSASSGSVPAGSHRPLPAAEGGYSSRVIVVVDPPLTSLEKIVPLAPAYLPVPPVIAPSVPALTMLAFA